MLRFAFAFAFTFCVLTYVSSSTLRAVIHRAGRRAFRKENRQTMTEDEYILLHKRLRRQYPNQYRYTLKPTLEHHYHNRMQAISAADAQAVFAHIANNIRPNRELTMLDIDQAITHCTSSYAAHGTPGRGLARILELDTDPQIATPEHIRHIRQATRKEPACPSS